MASKHDNASTLCCSGFEEKIIIKGKTRGIENVQNLKYISTSL